MARDDASASRQPQRAVVVLDDTGFGHLGCYGSPIATRNFDRLAADGVRFTNMHTTALCSPSRSCTLTVTVDVSGELIHDPEAELRAHMARQ